ncbi:MAG: pilus assembly protein PilM [Phycisphaerae bacterium]|nr:pilus assembly protein PilM [Phycisphaerae bacterium]
MMPIGVDLGSASVKLVQLCGVKDGVELAACGAVDIPVSYRENSFERMGYLAKHIPQVLRSGGFKSRKCVLGIPAENTFVRHIKIPRTDAKNTELAIRRGIQSELPYPSQEAVIRHVVAGEVYCDGEIRQEIIVVAIPLETMDAYLDMARRAGLKVVGVNIESLAIVECFANLFPWGSNPEHTALYIDLGSVSTQVVIAKGKNVVFARNLTCGSRDIDELIVKGMDVAEDKIDEFRIDAQKKKLPSETEQQIYELVQPWVSDVHHSIEQCMLYYKSVFRETHVDRLIFTGGQAMDNRLCQMLAKRLNLPAHIGDPMMGLRTSGCASGAVDFKQTPRPGLAVGIGLSFCGKED